MPAKYGHPVFVVLFTWYDANLEKVQRRATRFILRGFELEYKCRLIQLKLLPLRYFLEYLDLLFLCRCINGEIRLDISRFVQFSHSKTRCGTSGMDLRLNFARTSTFRESFFIRICPMWNALPLDIRTILQSAHQFLRPDWKSYSLLAFSPHSTRKIHVRGI